MNRLATLALVALPVPALAEIDDRTARFLQACAQAGLPFEERVAALAADGWVPVPEADVAALAPSLVLGDLVGRFGFGVSAPWDPDTADDRLALAADNLVRRVAIAEASERILVLDGGPVAHLSADPRDGLSVICTATFSGGTPDDLAALFDVTLTDRSTPPVRLEFVRVERPEALVGISFFGTEPGAFRTFDPPPVAVVDSRPGLGG